MASEWLFPPAAENEEQRSDTKNEELFVFGYHCKLFRDDEQARQVDAGTYMIPWMGDEKLKIDRYDGRGHLFDLRPYDSDNLKDNPPPDLSEDEIQLEKLCDEERYLELHTDIAEKTMYEEEEWKRYYESLAEGYKAVGFSYDGQPQAYTDEEPEAVKPNPDEAVFVPAKELMVPAGIPIPATVKENAIIEKTAKFIAEHGVQMEIVMKTKQANNPQFFFMHFENTLHPYYKHLVKMIKTKKYIPKSPPKEETHDVHNDSGEGDDGGHGYLHPTLMTVNRASPTPQEVYKPIPMPKVALHETPYGQLLQSFNKVNKEANKRREKEARIKQEMKASESSSLPVAQSEYGSMPPPPGIEPVQLPSSDSDVRVKREPTEHDESNNARSVSPPAQIVPPPPDLQPIIDRMAMYVAKNGEEFAIVVKSKNDARFQFLEPWHQHFQYYEFKRHLFQEEMERERKEKEAEEKRKEQEKAEQLAKGVKFKLKKANKEQEQATLDKKPVFEYDDSGDENDSDSTRDTKKSKSASASGTSTPVKDGDQVVDSRTSENLERKLAEQRLKDRLAASAREKLSQVDKEKQIKAERKKKAAMFINLLKSKNEPVEDVNTNTVSSDDLTTTEANTPVKSQDEKSSHHKSKHKKRDRSRDRRSRSRDRKRSRRSRSRSKTRSKKKKRKRSPTPPSAYNVVRRSPLRFPAPPPPPPRYLDVRSRESRSPSRSSKQRSRSRERSSRKKSKSKSPRSKSKKKKRSRSPKSRKDEHSHHRKSSKKKKKRSRSRERKLSDICEVSVSIDSPRVSVTDDARVSSPAGSRAEMEASMEEGETKESSPEPGQLTDTDTKDTPSRLPAYPADDSVEEYAQSSMQSPSVMRKRTISISSESSHASRHSKSKSVSPAAEKWHRSTSRSHSRSLSRSPSKIKSRSQSKSLSRSPSRSRSMDKLISRSQTNSRSRSRTKSRSISQAKSRSASRSQSRSLSPRTPVRRRKSPTSSLSREGTPGSISSREVTPSASGRELNGGSSNTGGHSQKNVSSYMLNRVRAIIKASREAIKEEEDMFADDT